MRLLTAVLALFCVWRAVPEAKAVGLADSVTCEGGYTTVSWTKEGTTAQTYTVVIQPVNGSAAQQMVKAAETDGYSARIAEILPGKTYNVLLMNEARLTLSSRTYTVPGAPVFEDGKLKNNSVKIRLEPRKMRGGGENKKDTKKIKTLKAAEIIAGARDESMDYGVRYTMKMPKLAKPRTFFVTVAFESPDGFLFTEVAADVTFDQVKGGKETIWFYMIGERFFKYLYKNTGNVPAGEYKTYLFWDGKWANTSTFKVN